MGVTSTISSAAISAAYRPTLSSPRPNAYTLSIGSTRFRKRSCALPWVPVPQIVTTRESGRARYFAATAVAAAVRWIVISTESIKASGIPFSPSKSRIPPWTYGSPRSRFCQKAPLHFTPT